jgi:hypothetical protein
MERDLAGGQPRWSKLFDDLQAQLDRGIAAEDDDFRAEEERLRLGRLTLRDRLSSLRVAETELGHHIAIRVFAPGGTTDAPSTGRLLRIRVAALGDGWLAGDLVEEPGTAHGPGTGAPRRNQIVVPLTAIVGVTLSQQQVGLSLRPALAEASTVAGRLTLTSVLRDLARRRRPVDVCTTTGESHGTIDRVGRDHFDLATHEPETPRRISAVTAYSIVPFDRLVFLRM